MTNSTMVYLPWPREDVGGWAGVWLESVGHRDLSRPTADPDPGFFCTHLVVRGEVRLRTVNGVDRVIGPAGLFSIWPQIGHDFAPEPPWSGSEVDLRWLRLRGPCARSYMRRLGTDERRPWGAAARPAAVARTLDALESLARHDPPDADLRAGILLHELILACGDPAPPDPERTPLAERVHAAMGRQVGSDLNVDGFARAFGVSRSTLFLHFKRRFGRSPVAVLTDLRLAHARRLLRETDLPIAAVARASGYDDPLYFSRVFRRAEGRSPSAFRAVATAWPPATTR